MFCCRNIKERIKEKMNFWKETSDAHLHCKNHNKVSKESLIKSTKFSAEDLATFSELFQKYKLAEEKKDDYPGHQHEFIKKGEFKEIMSYLS
jgi:hypothetical protein